MKMRSILFIGIAGLLSACSTINYVGIETYNPAEVTFPENVAKVLIVNNAVPQPEERVTNTPCREKSRILAKRKRIVRCLTLAVL